MKKLFGLFIVAALGGLTSLGAYKLFFQADQKQAAVSERQVSRFVNIPAATVKPEAMIDFTSAAANTVNAVVHVTSTYTGSQSSYDPFRDFFREYRSDVPRRSSGSGVILTEDGFIVTNNHVVNNASEVEITLNDNRQYTAEVVGTDPSTDLALLKIDEDELPFVYYGNSDEVEIGEWVLAVGNPFNLTSTVTAGIVSAKARNINILPERYAIESFIQTDAAVNPGNSGGALVNTRGELVGINTAIASETGSYSGYSFAVPVNIVVKVVDDLLEYGTVQRGFIGVSIRDMNPDLAEEVGLDYRQGVYVNSLTEGGAASDAGIKAGDIITKVGDVVVKTAPELQEQVGRFRPGDKIDVTVIRDNREREFAVVLRNRNGNTNLVKKDEVISMLGAQLAKAGDNELQSLGIDHGVKISGLSAGRLKSEGVREGFIILEINKKKMYDVDDVTEALKGKSGGVLIEGIYPNGRKAYYGFGLN